MEKQSKKSIIEDLKTELDEIEGKLKKSSDEYRSYFELKRQKFADLIRQFAHQLEQSGEEKVHSLRDKSRDLLDMLESDYDLSYTDFESESHKISKAIDRFEAEVKDVYERMSDKGKSARAEFEGDINRNLEKFKTELDIQKAHWKGTRDRAKAEYEDWKAKRLNDIEELKKELEERKHEAGDKFESFTEEINESFSHLKNAFKKLW
jgi:hypothetical protein